MAVTEQGPPLLSGITSCAAAVLNTFFSPHIQREKEKKMWLSSFKPAQKDTIEKGILLNIRPKFSLISVDERSDILHLYPWRECSSLQIKKTGFLCMKYFISYFIKTRSIQSSMSQHWVIFSLSIPNSNKSKLKPINALKNQIYSSKKKFT